ncbi:MAG: MBL fold metallo-hydrolase [Solobacterium sp.]|nr:MBL fold metallo-hydrolase [Solobacterium sp.]
MRTVRNEFFEAIEVRDRIWQILGQGGELCYLVEGKERAVLIDGLTGAGSLKAFIAEMTELPVEVILTHGHLDHTGAAFEYGHCYIHPDDIPLMYSPFHSSRERRFWFATMETDLATNRKPDLTIDDCVETVPVITYPLYDGDVIDLGDRTLEVIGVPGHTYGTLVFLDRKERILFSGDACNINTLLGLKGSTSIEQYLESLHHLKTYEDAYDVMYGGHGRNTVDRSIVDDAIAMCERILAGTDDAEPAVNMDGKTVYYGSAHNADYTPACGGLCNIQYDKEKRHRRDVSPYVNDTFLHRGGSE